MLCFHGEPPQTCAGQGQAPLRVVALPGSFNPPTVAHLAMAERAAQVADEVLLVIPEHLPHKSFDGASFDQRIRMLLEIAAPRRFRVCSTPAGLYVDIALSCRERFPNAKLAIACGRDAAERTLGWTYPHPDVLLTLFSLAELWVFAREGQLEPPSQWKEAIRMLDFDESLQSISATEVRRRILSGEEWTSLVPKPVHGAISDIYKPH